MEPYTLTLHETCRGEIPVDVDEQGEFAVNLLRERISEVDSKTFLHNTELHIACRLVMLWGAKCVKKHLLCELSRQIRAPIA